MNCKLFHSYLNSLLVAHSFFIILVISAWRDRVSVQYIERVCLCIVYHSSLELGSSSLAEGANGIMVRASV
jgi:hypothetical protein